MLPPPALGGPALGCSAETYGCSEEEILKSAGRRAMGLQGLSWNSLGCGGHKPALCGVQAPRSRPRISAEAPVPIGPGVAPGLLTFPGIGCPPPSSG